MTQTAATMTIMNGDGVHVLKFLPRGVLDATGLSETRRYISRLLSTATRPRIVLDLGEVELLTSEAIGMVVSLGNTIRSQRGQLHLANISAETYTVLEITRLQGVIKIYASIHEAIGEFTG